MLKESGRIKILFWGTITIGIIMPIVALRLGVSYYFSGRDILLWLLHDIPFIFLAFLVRSNLRDKLNSSKPYILRLSEAIGAWVVTVGISFWMNLEVALVLPGASLAILGYYFYPFYGIITILIGYGSGWFIGIIILKVKRKHSLRMRILDD